MRVVPINNSADLTVTGKGKVTVIASSVYTIVSVDGVELNMKAGGSNTSSPTTVNFEKSIVVRSTMQNYGNVLIQLAN